MQNFIPAPLFIFQLCVGTACVLPCSTIDRLFLFGFFFLFYGYWILIHIPLIYLIFYCQIIRMMCICCHIYIFITFNSMRTDALRSIIMICLCVHENCNLHVYPAFGIVCGIHECLRKKNLLKQSISNWYRILSVEWSIFQFSGALMRMPIFRMRMLSTFFVVNIRFECMWIVEYRERRAVIHFVTSVVPKICGELSIFYVP